MLRFLSRGVGLAFLGIRDAPLTLSVPSVSVTVRRPTAAEQFAAWRESLAPEIADAERDQIAATLAGQFDLNLREIQRLAQESHAQTATDAGVIGRALWNASRDLGRQRLDALAQRLDVKATWDDLVLPDEQMNLVRRIAGQVRARHTVYDEWGFSERMTRGFGISALFAGAISPPAAICSRSLDT